MDIAIFIFALVQFVRKKYHWVFVSIFILVSNWLEIWFGINAYDSSFPFSHKTTDTGLILFLIIFGFSIIKFGFYKASIQKVIIYFYIFLLLNGIIDIIDNVQVGDIIRYCRGWVYLSVIWIDPKIYVQSIDKMLRILLFVILGTTIIIIWQNLNGNYTFAQPIDTERGIKPSFYVILFIPILFFDAIKYSKFSKWLMISIFLISIIINLKQTYLITVVLTLLSYVFIYQRKQISKLFGYSLLIIVGSLALLFTNDKFRDRIEESLTISNSIKYETRDSNASYRLLHTIERFNYIMENPETMIRGIGFIHEESFNKQVFTVGNMNLNTGERSQLDTPDIAWSNFFIRFGLLGTAVFIIMYISIVIQLYKNSKGSELSKVFGSFLFICLIFTSFGNAVISYSYFYIFPLMLISSIKHNK
ncbi:MAG: O-antigen ligase family protein [Prolixibacteraceae bacterium]